jgi:hypothetical protein
MSEGPADDVIRFLRERLKPAREPDAKEVKQLVADLDHSAFRTRETAAKRIVEIGPLVLFALEAARKNGGSPEFTARLDKLIEQLSNPVPPPEGLRAIRATAILERIGTDDARRLLETMARGAQFAPETKAAISTLTRMRALAGSW